MLTASLAHKVLSRPLRLNIPQDNCARLIFLLFGGTQEKERINTVLEENEKLLEEKRELLRKICEAEDMGSKGMRTASTVQYRCDLSLLIGIIINSNVESTARHLF